MNHRCWWWNICVFNQLFLPYRCARFSCPLFATSLTDNRTNSIQCLSKSTPQYGCGVLDLACDFFQCICRCCRHRSMLFLCETKAEKCQPCDLYNKCSTRYVSIMRFMKRFKMMGFLNTLSCLWCAGYSLKQHLFNTRICRRQHVHNIKLLPNGLSICSSFIIII